MSKAIITEQHLHDIADAIIAKGGATEPMTPAQMPDAIQAIPSGGGKTSFKVSASRNFKRICFGSAPLDYDGPGSKGVLAIIHEDGTQTTHTIADLLSKSVAADNTICDDAVRVGLFEIEAHPTGAVFAGIYYPESGRRDLIVKRTYDAYFIGGAAEVLRGEIPLPLDRIGYGGGNSSVYIADEYTFKQLEGDCEIEFLPDNYSCLLKGTLITLADRTVKTVEDITYDDDLLVWDFDNGCLATAKPLWIKRAEVADYWFVNRYASGRELLTTGQSKTGWGHRHFDVDRGEFRYTPTTVGDGIMTLDGVDEHISCEKRTGECEFYNIITERHMNLYANGVLTSCSMNNLYPVKEMRFVKDGRRFRTRDDYDGFVAGRFFDGLRMSEQIGDPHEITDYIGRLISNDSRR